MRTRGKSLIVLSNENVKTQHNDSYATLQLTSTLSTIPSTSTWDDVRALTREYALDAIRRAIKEKIEGAPHPGLEVDAHKAGSIHTSAEAMTFATLHANGSAENPEFWEF